MKRASKKTICSINSIKFKTAVQEKRSTNMNVLKTKTQKQKTEDLRPCGLKWRPTDLKQRPASLKWRTTSLKQRPTGVKRRPTSLNCITQFKLNRKVLYTFYSSDNISILFLLSPIFFFSNGYEQITMRSDFITLLYCPYHLKAQRASGDLHVYSPCAARIWFSQENYVITLICIPASRMSFFRHLFGNCCLKLGQLSIWLCVTWGKVLLNPWWRITLGPPKKN